MIGIGTPGTAVALQISGLIGFSGAAKAANNTFASASLGTATSIDYNGDGMKNTGIGLVDYSSGDFSWLLFSTATLYDFTFNPLAVGGVSPLWSVGGFSFALASVGITTQNDSQLSLVGTGIVSGNGFADTPGSWNFTGYPDGSVFNFWSGVVSPIPEPEIYAMMALGLGVMGWVARRRKLKDRAAA